MTQTTANAYMAVRHLPTAEAARRLGRAYRSVEEYRTNHPEAAYNPTVGKSPRPGTITLAVPIRDTSRSSEGTTARTMHITLPAPPPGVTFERQVQV